MLASYKIPTIRKKVLFNYGHGPKDIANGGEAGIHRTYFAIQSKTLYLNSEVRRVEKH